MNKSVIEGLMWFIATCGMFGMVLPAAISAKSDVTVFLGILVGLVFVIGLVSYITGLVKKFM